MVIFNYVDYKHTPILDFMKCRYLMHRNRNRHGPITVTAFLISSHSIRPDGLRMDKVRLNGGADFTIQYINELFFVTAL